MRHIFDGYRPGARGKRRNYPSVLLSRIVEKYLKNRAVRNLASGAPQFFILSSDHISNRIVLGGVYERDALDAAFDFLKKADLIDGVALDVGANLGNHSLYLSHHFEKVVSFEPNPTLFTLLSANASLAGNIEARPFGLSDAAGSASLQYISDYNSGEASVAPKKSPQSSKLVEIELKRLDDIADLPGERIGLIKIDVENLEINVLKGARETILRDRPVIFFEQHDYDFPADGGDSPVVGLLRELGYSTFYEVDEFPRLPATVSKHLKNAGEYILKSLFGYASEVREVKTFERRFHSFIIAVAAPVETGARRAA